MTNENTYENSGKLTFTLAGSQTVTWEMTPVKKTPRKNNNLVHSKFSINTSNPVIFEIDRHPLGKGSYGTTKRAKKINSEDWSYVIKKIRVNLNEMDEADSGNHDKLLSAHNEYNHLRKIRREAHFFYLKHGEKKTKNSQEYTHTVYLMMPYLGQSLYEFLKTNNNQNNFSQKLKLAIQLIDIVNELNKNKISHQDIKPQNITIDSNVVAQT